MKNIVVFIQRRLWTLLIVVGLLGSVGAYFYSTSGTVATTKYAVVQAVEKGTVSSGIQATGEIVAAHKLNLDVYKQTRRIEAVNVQNGDQVKKGDVLFSFDKSSAYVDVGSSRVKVAEAELSLSTERENITDPNTTLRTKQNEVAALKISIAKAENDIDRAYQDFLNTDLSAEPGEGAMRTKERPLISGLYTGVKEGEYNLKLYRSNAGSGLSFSLSGLEKGSGVVSANVPNALGTKGLKIVFPDDMETGDTWIVSIPNTRAPTYSQNKEDYKQEVADLEKAIAEYRVSIANKEQEIKNLLQTDTASYRNLDVSKAEASLSQARVELSQNYDVVKEQDIVAPFSGTIEGLANVVVGATPTRDTNDPISLGTLISDEFLVKFTLGAVDVAKIKSGQKVLVTVTSFPNMEPVPATVTEISSLPDAEGVAQYGVQALISLPSDSKIELREGLLADVEVVMQEVENVVRIPLSAITYENGVAKVQVVGEVTAEEQKAIDTVGVLSSNTGVFPSYPVEVTLGISGAFYAEVTKGLEEGARIIVSQSDAETKGVVQQQGPGAPRSAQGQAGTANTRTQSAPSNSRTQ